MQAGWIKIHRKIADNMIFQDPFFLKLWMLCLLKAAHKPFVAEYISGTVRLQPGQFITWRDKLAEDFNIGIDKKSRKSESTVWRMLKRLEALEMVQVEGRNKYSIVTIVNWHEYQEEDSSKPDPLAKPPKPPKDKNHFDENSTYYKMAVYFRGKVEEMAAANGLQHLTKKTNMQAWAKDFELLVERDGQKDRRLIQAVMEWVVKDEFWSRNILSAKSFRKQFPKLVLKMNAGAKTNGAAQLPSTEERQRQQDYDDALREWVMEGHDPSDFRFND